MMKKCKFCKGTGESSYVQMSANAKDGTQEWIKCKCPDCNGLGVDTHEEVEFDNRYEDYIKHKKLENMRKDDIIKTQKELNGILEDQIIQLTMISKIELGDDVIEEIKRLKTKLNQNKDDE